MSAGHRIRTHHLTPYSKRLILTAIGLSAPAQPAVAQEQAQPVADQPAPPPAAEPAAPVTRAEEATPSVLDAVAPEARAASRTIGLTLIPSFRGPVSMSGSEDDAGGTVSGQRGADTGPVLGLTAHYVPKRNWFAQIGLYHYVDSDKRRPWNGDFSYALGYSNPKPHTFSLTYSNYANNRFNPARGKPVSPVELGSINLGWKFRLPRALDVDASAQRSICSLGYHVQPRYEKIVGTGAMKQAASVGCTYPIWKMLYVEGEVFVYTDGQRQAWDPDFTYSFGWFNWRPKTFSLQYSNYSGNRFFWSESKGAGGFKKGSVSLSWRLAL